MDFLKNAILEMALEDARSGKFSTIVPIKVFNVPLQKELEQEGFRVKERKNGLQVSWKTSNTANFHIARLAKNEYRKIMKSVRRAAAKRSFETRYSFSTESATHKIIEAAMQNLKDHGFEVEYAGNRAIEIGWKDNLFAFDKPTNVAQEMVEKTYDAISSTYQAQRMLLDSYHTSATAMKIVAWVAPDRDIARAIITNLQREFGTKATYQKNGLISMELDRELFQMLKDFDSITPKASHMYFHMEKQLHHIQLVMAYLRTYYQNYEFTIKTNNRLETIIEGELRDED